MTNIKRVFLANVVEVFAGRGKKARRPYSCMLEDFVKDFRWQVNQQETLKSRFFAKLFTNFHYFAFTAERIKSDHSSLKCMRGYERVICQSLWNGRSSGTFHFCLKSAHCCTSLYTETGSFNVSRWSPRDVKSVMKSVICTYTLWKKTLDNFQWMRL